jgi:hypothetical protein
MYLDGVTVPPLLGGVAAGCSEPRTGACPHPAIPAPGWIVV